MIKMLHSQGVNINQTRTGSSSLHNACMRPWSTVEEALVNTEIALWMIGTGADASSNNGWKESALHCASESGNHYLVKEILKILPASEINVESQVSGTPLYAAAFRGHIETVKILVESGVNLDVGCRGESPLEAAVLEGYTETIDFLRSKGAVRRKGDKGILKDVRNLAKSISEVGAEFVVIEKDDGKEPVVETVVEPTAVSGT
jgi:ankyrin repeat protein